MASCVEDAAVGASSAKAGRTKPRADPTRVTTKRTFISPPALQPAAISSISSPQFRANSRNCERKPRIRKSLIFPPWHRGWAKTPTVLVHYCGFSELPAARHARRELDLDAGFDLQVGRAPPAAIDGGLHFNIAVQHVAAFQLDHLAD